MESLLINMAIQIVLHFVKNPSKDAAVIDLLKKLYAALAQVPGVAS